jgi:hypothetical protein
MDESLEREAYEHSNSLDNCYGCGGKLEERESFITKEKMLYCPVCEAFMLEDE